MNPKGVPGRLPEIKGVLPRASGRLRLPRRKETEVTAKLGEEYLRRRNALLALKHEREEMLLAKERRVLIEKKLVVQEATYLMIVMRQGFLALPAKIHNRFSSSSGPLDINQVTNLVREEVHKMLTELSRLPECVEEDGWNA